jgi:hypothetical protein
VQYIAATGHGGAITDGWVIVIALLCLAVSGYIGYHIGLFKSGLNAAEAADNEALRSERQQELIERLAHASTEAIRSAAVSLAKTTLHNQRELNTALDVAEGKDPVQEE